VSKGRTRAELKADLNQKEQEREKICILCDTNHSYGCVW